MEKTPFRKDVSDGKRYPKAELRRFVVKEGKLLYDPEQRLPGRGYYLSKGSDPVKAEKAYAVYSVHEMLCTCKPCGLLSDGDGSGRISMGDPALRMNDGIYVQFRKFLP